MTFSYRLFLLLVFGVLNSLYSFSQASPQSGQSAGRTGSLTGRVHDRQTGSALEYANIALYRKSDSSLVDGGITNVKGVFLLNSVPYGRYYALLSFIGYPVYTIDTVFISPRQPDADLGKIYLTPSGKNIEGVEIRESRAQLEFNLDKKVYNVEQNMVSTGGTAIDIMQTIPAVQVDIEGNVSLRGSTNVNILVDGRPSGLVSLDQLPATMIDRVEIVTNPSARYDPDGTTGIINIVLKKQKAIGINGMVSLNGGTGDKYNVSANLNYRYKKINLFTTYDYRKFGMQGINRILRTTNFSDSVSYLNQDGDWRRSGYFHNIRTGMDFFINDKNTLSVSGLYNRRDFTNNDFADNLYYNSKGDTSRYFLRGSESRSGNEGIEAALNYTRKYNQKTKELTADVFYSYSDGNTDNDIAQFFIIPMHPALGDKAMLQRTLSANRRDALTAQTDFVTPLGSARLETGYKFSFSKSDMDYHFENYSYDLPAWQEDTTRSNNFVHSEMLHSVYLIYSRALTEKLHLQAGARAEWAQTKADQRTQDSVFTKNYFSLFPSAHIRYNFTDKNQVQLSYSRRINRPGASVLNPFINYADPLNLSAGNPALNPEYSNSLELGLTLQAGATTLNPSVFFRNTEGVISRIMTVDEQQISFTTYKNQDRVSAYGAEVILAQQFFKWWRVNANFSFFRTEFKGPDVSSETASNDSWTFRLNSMMTLPGIADIQFGFNYNAPVVFTPSIRGFRAMMGGSQGRLDASYWADLGLKRDILEGRATLSVRVRDLFNTQNYNITSYGENFVSVNKMSRESRVIFMGFSYKFNDYKRRQQREREINGMDDFE